MGSISWEAIGVVAEVVGAVAVVITLAYLAVQIKQSTRATRISNHQSALDSYVSLTSAMYSDAELSALFARALDDLEPLTKEERIRVHYLLTQIVLFYKDVLEAWDAGILDTPTMKAWEGFFASILAKPGGRRWWKAAGALYIDRVRVPLTKAVESAQPYDEILEFLQMAPSIDANRSN